MEPARSVTLCEAFLAGCHAKAEELDESSGSFGQFAQDPICLWIKARQASGADPHETATTLLAWIDDDPYAFCYQIEKAAAAAFDKAGLTAFQKLIRARFAAIASGEQSGYAYRQWSDVLRAIYLAQRNIAAYVALAGQTGLTPQDCLALGTLLATRKPNERWRGSSAGLPSTGKVMSAPQPPTTSTASARVADQTTTCKTRYEMELDASRRVRRQLIKVSSVRRRGGAGPENVGKRRILRTAKWRRGLEGRLLSGYESETLENVLAPLGEGANSWAVQPASA
jgi:hypothetical protein